MIVFTNGCFDLLHVGHVRYLAKARELGDHLIVGLNSDESFRRHKGRDPLFNEHQRAELLEALKSVDEVRIFNEDTPLQLLEEIRPDVLVKGDDYKPEDVVGREYAKRTVCIATGIQIHTRDILSKIKE
jgi:rfaE bifunctional protein nucleotidyltransferase chain/domain